jgi:hypothetical protein
VPAANAASQSSLMLLLPPTPACTACPSSGKIVEEANRGTVPTERAVPCLSNRKLSRGSAQAVRVFTEVAFVT